LGATETVAWTGIENIHDCIHQLKDQGYKVSAVEQVHGSISLEQLEIHSHQPIALIF
jgi:biotin operon repressor